MTALVVALTLIVAPLQVGLAAALFRDPLAAPLLPAVVVAAWAAVRRPEETWSAIVIPAIVFGAISEERVGWYLLALLPVPLIGAIAVRRFRPRATGFIRRVLTAGGAAALGAATYAAILVFAARSGGDLPGLTATMIASATLTGFLAVGAAACLWPLRPRQRGLFQ